MNPSLPTADVTIVSGLPRSGTSMMMRMLDAGGIEPLTDNLRRADADNPRGYYEFEPVKKIATDASWLPEACGKAVKMVSMLLLSLPAGYAYRVLFIQRDLQEVLASQAKMLQRLDKPSGAPPERMQELFEKHLVQVRRWLEDQPHIRTLYVSYADTIRDPAATAARVAEFLERPLNQTQMAAAVDAGLYRNRIADASPCHESADDAD